MPDPQARLVTTLIRLCLTLALCAVAVAARADIRVKVQESVNGSDPEAVVHWFGPGRSTRDDGNRYIVTRLDTGKTYIINRQTHQYRIIDMQLDAGGEPPEVTVTRTDDVREINGWTARRYRIGGPAARDMTIDVWVSDEVQVNIDAFRALMVRLGNRRGSGWLKAYRQISGFPVLQEVSLERPGLRLDSRSRVVAVEQVEPRPYTYAPPPGYARVD